MPGTHYAIKDRTFWANDTSAVATLEQDSTGPNLHLTHATAAELRLTEEDQTDPAGRYRDIVSGDAWIYQRAATASWGSTIELFKLTGSGAVFNEGSADLDLRIEGDTNANMVVIDAGTDTLALGGAVVSSVFASVVPAAFTGAANTNTFAFAIDPTGITVPAGTTAIAATLRIDEPVLTATGTITVGTTVYIQAAPTEGSSNYALWVDAGAVQFDSTLNVDGALTLGSTLTLGGAVTGANVDINNIGRIGFHNAAADASIGIYGSYSEITPTANKLGIRIDMLGRETAASTAYRLEAGRFTTGPDAANTQNWTANPGFVAVSGLISCAGTGTIDEARAFESKSDIAGVTLTDLYHLYVENATGAGTLTNQYGIYIADLTKGGTLDYGIYVAGADSNAIYVAADDISTDGLIIRDLSATAVSAGANDSGGAGFRQLLVPNA